jgi:tetratricopeptide (TPR) repeat protein
MRSFPVLLVLAVAGCMPSHDPAPEEEALLVYEQAEALYAEKRYAEAAPHYEFVIHHRNRWKDPHVKLARCYEATGRRAEAIRVLEKLLAFDRFDEEGRREIARLQALGTP